MLIKEKKYTCGGKSLKMNDQQVLIDFKYIYLSISLLKIRKKQYQQGLIMSIANISGNRIKAIDKFSKSRARGL